MNELSKFLVESILSEAAGVENMVVVYAGRFQPFHKGHYATYSHLVKKFGKNNVYIGTSNKTDNQKSPFNFKEKKEIMTTMFGVPSNKIVEVKNPYQPTEVMSKFDKDTTAFITVVGKKDATRLGGKYFEPYKDNKELEGYRDKGYVYIAPEGGDGVSGTEVRMGLRRGSDQDKKEFFTKRAYGKFNPKIFKFIAGKLAQLPEITSENIWIPKHMVEEWLINNVDLIKEASSIIGKTEVDDGPNFLFPSYAAFEKISKRRAEKIGMEVLSQIMSDKLTDIDPHPIYPKGPVKAVTPFPAGVVGKVTATNQKDYYGSVAYNKWFKHATRLASLVGYSLVDSIELEINKVEAEKIKKIPNLTLPTIKEDITIPVNIGDTILMGRFKNKKVVVKSIGKDEYGMPTINGKKVATFRMIKEGTQVFFEIDEEPKSDEDKEYKGIGGQPPVYVKSKDYQKWESNPDGYNGLKFKKTDSGKYVELDKDGNEKLQSKQGTSLEPTTQSGKDYISNQPDDDPAKKQQSKEEPKQDNWEKVDDKNNYYKSVRKYTDKELEDETGEYYENETTMKTAPNAFKDKADMIEKMKNAKAVYLPSEQMENMNNTDMGDILKSDNPKQTAKERADEYDKDISWQYDVMEKGESVPPPIALRDKNGEYHLLAGNTRAMAFTAAGRKLPIKVIDYDGEFQYNESLNVATFRMIKEGKEIQFDYIGESDIVKLKNTLGIERDDLPQIPKDTIEEYVNYLESNQIPFEIQFQPVASLNASQTKINLDKVKDMMSDDDLNNTPIIVSKDDYILDGHHRALAAFNVDNQSQIPVIKVHLPIDKLIDVSNNFEGSHNKSIEESQLNEIPMADLVKIDSFADKQLNPVDVVLTDKHFFDRLNDPRNGKEISNAELIGFFKRLGKNKKKFVEFLNQYHQIVAKDNRTNINIPFMKQANKVIAKTIMRKGDFKTSDPEYQFETIKHIDGKWVVYPKDGGDRLGTHDTKEKALAQLKAIEISKHEGIEEAQAVSGGKVHKFITGKNLGFKGKKYSQIEFETLGVDNKTQTIRLKIIAPKEIFGNEMSLDFRTIRRGPFFKTDVKAFENLGTGYPDEKWLDDHQKELDKLRKKFDNEKHQYNEPYALGGGITEGLILEGGAYGHMNHPFDTEINLTFGQLKDIVNKALEGNLELTREKTDGQALAVSWRDGRLVAARNKGHLKNKGAGALDINGVATKFAGRGELEKAYNFAMKDLTQAISKLSEKQREKIFKGGACFMNLEVIYPTSVNVIPYGQALLVFHGTMEYNEDGIAIGENQDAAKILAGMIKQVNADVQSAYTIQGPPVVQLPKSKNLSSMKGKYNGQISKLQSKFKLKDTDGVAEYHQAWWMDFVTKNSPSKLDNKTLMGLVKRWAFYDKGFRLDSKNITDEKTLEWAQTIDKNDHAKMAKDNIRPFEDIFLGVGAEVLQFMSSALTANPDSAVRNMKKRLDQTITDVQKSGDEKKVAKLKLELERLNAIGGRDKIVPNEGIVFVYGGKTFKLTGTFAPLNQILGLFYE